MISSYLYRDYFYDQSHKKNILIVQQGCNVSAEAGKPPKIEYDETVETPLIIMNEDIIREEFELSECINSADNLSFGSCEAGLLKFTIRHKREIPWLTETNETTSHATIVKLYFYFDDDSLTLMYYGMYICQKDDLSEDGATRSIECVDLIAWLRDFDIYEWYKWKFLNMQPRDISGQGDTPDPTTDEPIPEPQSMTVKQIRDSMFDFINGTSHPDLPDEIKLDFYIPIDQDVVVLPNDSWSFKYKVTTQKLSFMQMLEDICEINGRFGHIGRRLDIETDRCVFEYVELPRYDADIDDYNKLRNPYSTKNIKHDYYITKGIRSLTIYNADAKEIARYEKGIPTKKDDQGHEIKDYTAYSEYIIYDNKFIDAVQVNSDEASSFTNMLKNIYSSIRYRTYTPFEVTVMADLCRELGDRIGLVNDFDPYNNKDLSKEKFKSYILERVIKGIQNMTDTYTAKGDRVIPKFGDSSSSSGYYSYSGGGFTVSSKSYSGGTTSTETNEGNVVGDVMTTPEDLVEYVRNFGIRLLNEPEVVYEMTEDGPSFKWKDPADITNNKPCPATWAGTVVIRKKGSIPRNAWDFKASTGGILIDSTVRDAYLSTSLVDDGTTLSPIDSSSTYYYGIFPYDTDGHYRYTKVIKVTPGQSASPSITDISQDGSAITVEFSIPSGRYTDIYLVYKKGKIPNTRTDGSYVALEGTDEQKTVNIAEKGEYYFIIFATKTNGTELESEPVLFDVLEFVPKVFTTVIEVTSTLVDSSVFREEITIERR